MAFFACGKLPRHSLHAKGAAARHKDRRLGVVNLFQNSRDVLHHALKALRHVVQSAIGVYHRKLQQSIRVNV